MPDYNFMTTLDGTVYFLTDTIDTAVYTEFSNVFANIDENIGSHQPSELVMALTDKEMMTGVCGPNCAIPSFPGRST